MTNSDDSDKDNVWIALLLVIGAGAATALGSMVVFFPSLVKYANRKTLAGALGLSAGVMCYVSFVEIFQKSIGSFGDADFSEDDGYLYATLCFFGGVVAMMVRFVLPQFGYLFALYSEYLVSVLLQTGGFFSFSPESPAFELRSHGSATRRTPSWPFARAGEFQPKGADTYYEYPKCFAGDPK